ncbi:hypothetical protein ILUMI_20988 [Ignelater luminosus]|uniref:Uncharacterized protein n=1 Tax=Ignelater luminosus TaxID=2038154 RepID=A0A8K0CHE6_IGNLU|nr:hypothetical protein ILUMI_20988 [Ignelater luminosus]
MAGDQDAEARLLDGIVGKYGDDDDYGDIGNADEDALLEGYDDADFGDIKHSSAYQDDTEEHEEAAEDILDLLAHDGELEDDVDDGNTIHNTNVTFVSSTTQPEGSINLHNQGELEERERGTDKFKNERQNPSSKSYSIPDSLDEVPVQNPGRNNWNNQRTVVAQRGRGGRGGNQRNNQMQRSRPDNKTVLINPHFKGQVKINNDARLAWDARHRINQNKNQGVHQIGRVQPFTQNNRKPNQAANNIQPWMNNGGSGITSNVPQYQPAPTVYQPVFQPPPQVANWNQYQPNTFNQVTPQMGMPTHQNVFMQPLPQFPNQTVVPQFNQPPPQFNSQSMFQNQNVNPQPSIFPNSQFVPQLNQFNQPNEPAFHSGYQPNQPPPNFNQPNNNQFIPPQPNVQFNQPVNNRFVAPNPLNNSNNNNNQFRNQQRFSRPKPNFNQGKGQFNQKPIPKRKMEGNMDQRKIKKRASASTNLHEVPTVETPDTTVKEDKQPQEEEDEETKAYRKKIEEQKRLRLKILEQKEKRRQQASQKLKQAENVNASAVTNPPKSLSTPHFHQQQQQPQKPRQIPQKNPQVVRINQPLRNTPRQAESHPTTSTSRLITQQSNNRNIKVINTSTDESNINKQHLASFLSNRKILTKDQSLVDTSVVVISNLAAGTTDVKLRKMCQGIGEIKVRRNFYG